MDRLKILVGTYTDQYLSALGLGSDGSGGGIDIDAMWSALGNADLTKQIDISHISTALSSYATQTWVTAQLNAMEYVSQALGENGLLTLATNKGNSFVIDLTHQHSWFEIQDRPTTLAGYGLSNEVKLDNGVITIAGQTITPVTSVAMTVPLGLNVSGSPITKTGTFAVTYASGYEGFTTALKQKIEALFSWFEVDENGNVKTKDYTDGGTTKHRGFYSPSFISALGMGDDGSAGSGDVTWALLADNTDRRKIALSHLTDALAGYATQSWVLSQGFLTEHQSLANYYTKSETNTAINTAIGALEYINQVIAGDGMFTLRTNKSNDFVLDLTHQHSWFELQDKPTTIAGFGIVMTAADIPALDWSKITTGKPTTLSGYGITDAYINNGTIYLGSGNITPVTQVIMTVPAGFNISGSPLTKTGTLGLTYATGYEGFTTDLKNKINALFSWFEVDENGDIKTKDYTSGSETKHRGFYSPSFISALGQGSDGSAGQGDVTWALLADGTDTRQIALSHLTTALSGYATQAWVNGLGFATQSWVTNTALAGYATQAWVNQQGFATTATLNALEFLNSITSVEGAVTFSTNKNNSFVLDLTHSHSWFEIQDRPDTFAGFGLAAELNSTLSGYVTQATFNALEYMNQATGADGVLTLTTNKGNEFIVDFTHQHSFLELVDRPTTLAGYGITDATIANLMGSSSKGGSTTPVYWNGSAWVNCTSYGSASVNYATSAGSASSAAYATSAGSASSANYATSAGSASSADYASTAGAANNATFYINGATSDLPRLVLHISQVHYTRIMMDSSGDIHIADEGSPSAYKGLTAGSLTAKGNLYVSTNNTTGGGIILSDDGDIVDNNDGYCAMRFSNGVQIYSANRGGSAVITLGNGGGISCSSLYATGSVTALSDARKKDIQGDVNLSVEQIALAPAVKFLWKDRRDEGMQAGTIAQYWQGVLPEVVTEKNEVLGMSYGVAALIASIVTAKKVVDHERRIKELERENEILKNEVKQLKAA